MGTAQTNGLPPWIQGENISMQERMEIFTYKLVAFVPVLVTFSVFGFLSTYYISVSAFAHLSDPDLVLPQPHAQK